MKKIKLEKGKGEDGKMKDSEVEAEENKKTIWRQWQYVRNYPYFSCKCDQIPTANTLTTAFSTWTPSNNLFKGQNRLW